MLATDVAVASDGTCLASLGESSDGASDATAVASETAACGVSGWCWCVWWLHATAAGCRCHGRARACHWVAFAAVVPLEGRGRIRVHVMIR